MEYVHEMRGIARSELLEYFVDLNGRLVADDTVRGTDWEVKISPVEYVSLGIMQFSAVKVTFHTTPERYETMLWAFRLKFLKVGG